MSIYDKASLVLIPSGTKTSKVYSQKPTNGDGDFTFSRSTAATRVNASGNIEKETQNFLTYSNTFDTYWGTSGSVTGGQAGYDGSNDAWKLTRNAAFNNTANYFNSSGVQTFSVYAKAGTFDWIYLRLEITSPSTSYQGAYFNIADGTIGYTESAVIKANVDDVGNGWYRCSITFNQSIARVLIYAVPSNTGVGASGVGDIYIQDAQVEQGLVARDYIETTTTAIYGGITDNVPRLDYTDSSCPALLLEPQRSNLLIQSEYYDTTPYSRVNASVTHNDTTSPEGVLNAAKLISSGGASRIETFPTLSDNTTYTASIFAKRGNVDYIMVNLRDKNNDQHNTYFDLANGTKGSSNGSPISSSIEAVGDYYRVILTINSSSGGTTPRLQYLIANTDDNVVTASGEYIYVYGATLEAGSYATSYIPTYGSAVTRNEEIFKTENIQTNGLITPTAWTLFFNYNVTLDTANQYRDLIAIYGSKSFRLETRTNGQVRAQQSGMVISGDNFNAQTIGTTSNTKFAITFTTSQVKIYVDGVLVSTYNGAYEHDFNVLNVRNSNTLGTESELKYKQVLLFPTALTDQEAIDLTTI